MPTPRDNARFQRIEPLGTGGTAEVVKAFVTDLHIKAALKFPLNTAKSLTHPFADLAQREYALIGDRRYPGLVRLLEPPQREGEYLMLELCEGPSLAELGRVEDPHKTLDLISAIAVDLEFLNAAGLVHGDLKPENIFIPPYWADTPAKVLFYAKLSDFSLGRLVSEDNSRRLGLGTVGYMAPETITDSVVSHSSDLFALGVTAYQLLTGRHPFMHDESEPMRVNARVREEEPYPVNRFRRDIPPEVAGLVSRLLAKDASDRPGKAIEVCRELEALGACYPFARALRPAHLLQPHKDYEENVRAAVSVSEAEKERLDLLCDGDNAQLRLVLTANFVRHNMVYDAGRFHFKQTIYWPAACRRRQLQVFQSLPDALKKESIMAAVVGDYKTARKLNLTGRTGGVTIPPALITLLRPLLRTGTVRKLSARYALQAERLGRLRAAVDLFIQAGELDGAERCAYQCAIELNRDHRNTEAVALINRVIRYAALLNNQFFVRNLLMLRGDCHKENGETEEALLTYRELIDLYRNRPPDKLLAETYKDLGDLYRLRQEFARGLEALEQSLDIFRQLDDRLEISHVLNNLGNIYWLTAQLPDALSKYRRALRIQRQLDARAEVASTLNNIGNVYGAQGRYTRCLSVLNLALEFKKEIGHAGEIARTLNNLGYAFYMTGEIGRAADCLSESLELNRRIGSKKEILFNLSNLAEIMITAGQLRASLDYFREGLELAQSLNSKADLGVFNANLAAVYRRLGRFSEAEDYLKTARQFCREMDHRFLETALQLQEAALRHAVGDDGQALSLARQALDEADSIGHSESQLGALLLITRMSDDPAYVRRTEELTENLHMARERQLLAFNRLEFLLERRLFDKAEALAEQLQGIPVGLTEDIELAWMCNLIGEALLEAGEPDRAETFVGKALTVAQRCRLLPEMVVGLALSARLQHTRGAWERCYQDSKKGLQLCKEIVDSLRNEADRQRYRQKRSVAFLAKQIKQLGELLGDKGRAG
ncbi:MAG TPA: tetratricopeptide repeat protein [Acidobacteriota bacterium]|nr:tetratricopeptide repeat protein [Acidobacteriota bacterium]